MSETNNLMAILTFIGSVCGVYELNQFFGEIANIGGSSNIIIYYLIIIVLGILGLSCMYLFDQDYRIAVIEYVLGGIGMILFVRDFCILSILLYFIAAINAYMERDESRAVTTAFNQRQTNIYFLDTPGRSSIINGLIYRIRSNYNMNVRLLAIPIITLILLIVSYMLLF